MYADNKKKRILILGEQVLDNTTQVLDDTKITAGKNPKLMQFHYV